MLNGAVTHRYTQGLFLAAVDVEQVANVDGSLQALAVAIAHSASIQRFFENPLITPEQKLDVLQKVLSGRVPDVLLAFLAVLFKRKRAEYVPAIASAFHARANDYYGRVDVRITSAKPLTEEQRASVTQSLKAALSKEIEAVVEIDPDLIAGYKLQLGNRLIDSSVKNALRQLSVALLEKRIV